jgi:hypothetical protein
MTGLIKKFKKRKLAAGCLVIIGLVLLLLFTGWVWSLRSAKLMEKKNVPKPGSRDIAVKPIIDLADFVAYLDQHGQPPVDYLISKFKAHDVVILGEMHEVRDNCEFVSISLEPLYHRAGVTCLALECLKYKDNARIEQLVTGKTYDRELALDIFRDCVWPLWGFQQYMDMLQSAWELNHKLPPEAPRFRVIGLDSDLDASQLECGSKLAKLRMALSENRRDGEMAEIVARENLQHHRKILVLIGAFHTFPRYRTPVLRGGRLIAEAPPRFGGLLRVKPGIKTFQVLLHQPDFTPALWTTGNPELLPMLGGLLEQAVTKTGGGPVGFDVINSPFAKLRDSRSAFYALQRYVTFSDLAEGYILLKPIKQTKKVTWAKGYINSDIFPRARAIAGHRGWIKPNQAKTPAALDKIMQDMYPDK